jgi:hypothetical protein
MTYHGAVYLYTGTSADQRAAGEAALAAFSDCVRGVPNGTIG